MSKFSRSQWAQIVKRVNDSEFKFQPKWKCLICGKKFYHNECAHTADENIAVINLVRNG